MPSAPPKGADESPLLNNALYRAGRVPAVNCRFPAGRLATKATLLKFGQAAVACLDLAWRPLVSRSAVEFRSPAVAAVKVGDSTDCGEVEDDTSAFYCSADNTIYFDWTLYVEGEHSRTSVQVAVIYTMGHEYGHHLQELTGISDAYGERYRQKSGDAQLEQTRRSELQASCLASAFFGANQRTLALTGNRLYHLRWHEDGGDAAGFPRDHGSPGNNRAWSRAAFASKNPASCNTWAAPAKKVS
ncbi:neutral zinc metallopeptidase [Kribbella sp. NPDC056861]|uniref:neutral zinc metallopeptidase n=1 Tax=Kribbella sp. NPDC056861 TaxID=3154857 RepID=UPI003440F88A